MPEEDLVSDQDKPQDEPRIIITPGDDEDPEAVSGDPVDESTVLGRFAYLADPAAHQGGDR